MQSSIGGWRHRQAAQRGHRKQAAVRAQMEGKRRSTDGTKGGAMDARIAGSETTRTRQLRKE